MLLACNPPLALSQSGIVSQATQAAPDDHALRGVLAEVVVIGVRASLALTQDIKRDKLEIVDSIVADDITMLPDFSVADALQWVTGLPLARDQGRRPQHSRSRANGNDAQWPRSVHSRFGAQSRVRRWASGHCPLTLKPTDGLIPMPNNPG